MQDSLSLPLLITSAVRASSSRTVLGNEQDRLRETLCGLGHWARTPGLRQIVLCDGSGFDFTSLLNDFGSENPHLEIEALTFANDATAVRTKGKGYGEGEIVNHALENSRILAAAPAFAKCTGKLWVANFQQCLSGFNAVASFDYNGRISPRFIDTRFYMVDKGFYRDVLADVYRKVDDEAGFYLEHAYQQALRGCHLSDYAMCPTPRIRGMSGSMGSIYQVNEFKALLRDLRSRLVKALNI